MASPDPGTTVEMREMQVGVLGQAQATEEEKVTTVTTVTTVTKGRQRETTWLNLS